MRRAARVLAALLGVIGCDGQPGPRALEASVTAKNFAIVDGVGAPDAPWSASEVPRTPRVLRFTPTP